MTPPRRPGPAAHLEGTRALLGAFARLAGAGPLDPRVDALLGDPAALPAEGEGLKYDAYLTSAPSGLAWGFTVNTRWEGEAALARFGAYVAALGGDYAWEVVAPFWRGVGGVLTLGVAFDRPGAPPRLKLYAQEDAWGAGVAAREAVEALAGRPLPAWFGPRVGVVALQLHPDGARAWKAYRGAETAAAAAAGGPPEAEDLARRLAAASPLGPAWYYLTLRMDAPPRYAINKVYGQGTWRVPGRGDAPWRDAAALFASAGRSAAFEALRGEGTALRGVTVLPTATALEDGGRSADLYCGAWRDGR